MADRGDEVLWRDIILFLLEFWWLSCESTRNHENQPDRFGGNHSHRFGDLFDVHDWL